MLELATWVVVNFKSVLIVLERSGGKAYPGLQSAYERIYEGKEVELTRPKGDEEAPPAKEEYAA